MHDQINWHNTYLPSINRVEISEWHHVASYNRKYAER